MAGGGVGEAALAAEALGAAEVAGTAAGAGAGFLEGMAGVSALEGAGVAGLGLGTGAGLGAGTGLAGGLGALSPAFQTALGETAVFNPETFAQAANAANVGAVPSASSALGAGQIGDLASQGVQGLQAGNFAQPIPAQYQTAMGQLSQGATQYPGTQLASVGNAGVSDALSKSLAGPGEAGWGMDLGANEVPFVPGDPRASVPPVEGMVDAATGKMPGSAGFSNPVSQFYDWYKQQDKPTQYGIAGLGAMQAAKYLNKPQGVAAPEKYSGPLSKFTYSPDTYRPYNYRPYAAGGPVEEMSRENAIGANTGYPQADIQQGAYATPWQTPVSRNVVAGSGDANVDQMTGEERMAGGGIADLSEAAKAMPDVVASRQNFADFLARYQNLPVIEAAAQPAQYQGLYYTPPGGGSGAPSQQAQPQVRDMSDPNVYGTGSKAGGLMHSMASGGMSDLGSYSDGGRLLKGPGDGMSDDIPASISGKQPARLADGEFVVPADVVSGLGNGSTDAGAKHLYSMMDKVRKARTGTKKQGREINPRKYLPT